MAIVNYYAVVILVRQGPLGSDLVRSGDSALSLSINSKGRSTMKAMSRILDLDVDARKRGEASQGRPPKKTREVDSDARDLKFWSPPTAVVRNAAVRRNTQLSAKERKRAQTQVCKRAQKGTKERKMVQKSAKERFCVKSQTTRFETSRFGKSI